MRLWSKGKAGLYCDIVPSQATIRPGGARALGERARGRSGTSARATGGRASAGRHGRVAGRLGGPGERQGARPGRATELWAVHLVHSACF